MRKFISKVLILLLLTAPTYHQSFGDDAQGSDSNTKISSSHRTRGLINLAVIGFQVGTGIGLRTQEPNPDISLRAMHVTSAVALLGLGLYDLDDMLQLKTTREDQKAHRILGYTYLGLLLTTAVVGLIRVRAFEDRSDPSAKTWSDIHTGLALATAGTLIGSAITVHF
jgi:hypothetical protein